MRAVTRDEDSGTRVSLADLGGCGTDTTFVHVRLQSQMLSHSATSRLGIGKGHIYYSFLYHRNAISMLFPVGRDFLSNDRPCMHTSTSYLAEYSSSFHPAPTLRPPSFLLTLHQSPTSLSRINCQITPTQL